VRNLVLQILMLAGICFSQQSSPARKNDSPLLDQQKPSVYLSFAKYEKQPSRYGGDVQVVWLDIHNNTKWSIWSVGSPDELGGSGWCYSVATQDPCRTLIPPYWSCGDVGGPVGLEPGRTARLAVPAKYLSRGLAIEIGIGFDWENVGSGGVRHVAPFGHSDLPDAVRAALPFDFSIIRPSSACTEDGQLLDPPAISMPAAPSVPLIESILPPVPKLEPPSTPPKKKD
jgi:hypothetical protein